MDPLRRRLLGWATLGGAAATGATTFSLPQTLHAQTAAPPETLKARAAQAFDEARAQAPTTDAGESDAIVVGTGYGAAVAALRLAEAGLKVRMLEMGRLWTRPSAGHDTVFPAVTAADERAMWFRDKTAVPTSSFLGLRLVDRPIPRWAGVLDRMDFAGINVYVGRGVGGGSLVNGGMAVTPPEAVFRASLPAVDATSMYSTWFPLARRMLGVNNVDPAWFENADCYRYARISRTHAQKAGLSTRFVPSTYDFTYMAREAAGEVPRSALAGEVIFGNNHGKLSLDKTYLADAVGTGRVTVHTLHRVTRLQQDASGRHLVTVSIIDETGKKLGARTFTCRHLVLGAGSLGTTELLLRARDTGDLPGLTDRIGAGWGTNGNIMCARANHLWDTTGTVQATMPALAIDNTADPVHPVFAEIAPFPSGFENWVSLYLSITRNPERARLHYDAANDAISLDWRRDQNGPAIQAASALFDRINASNWTIYRSDLFGGPGKVWGDDFTYHPLGGAVLGDATDGFGRVQGVRNLYVVDSALLPGNIGVNPFVTITALAERNMAELIRRGG